MTNGLSMTLDDDIAAAAATTEAFLDDYLGPGKRGVPERLRAAMRHGSLAGGKRLRPYLVRVVAAMFGVAPEASVAAGAAVEMVHCYSLIHDDLPDMDNDRLRRGKPTVWAAYDPATAILAGDALLTEAFGLLADDHTHADPAVRLRLVRHLAGGAGAIGMVGGQMLDMEGEGEKLDLDDIFAISSRKTGALITAAMEMGAVLGGADAAELQAITQAGRRAGLAFQIADDILDVTASTETLGKTAGKDAEQEKATVVALRGLPGAQALLDEVLSEALAALDGFGGRAVRLREVITFLARRTA